MDANNKELAIPENALAIDANAKRLRAVSLAAIALTLLAALFAYHVCGVSDLGKWLSIGGFTL
jgi:hypothetical protein